MFQPPVHPDKMVEYLHAGNPTLDGPRGVYYTEPNGGPTPRPNTVIDGGFVPSSDDELEASSAGPALPRAKHAVGSIQSGPAKGPWPEEASAKRRKVDSGPSAATVSWNSGNGREMTTWDSALLQMREEDAAAPQYPDGSFESWVGAEIRGSTAKKRDAWRLQQAPVPPKGRGASVRDGLPTRAGPDERWGTPVTYDGPHEGQPPSGSWEALQAELNMLGNSPPAAAAAPNTYVVDRPHQRLYHARPPSEFTHPKKWQYLAPKSFHKRNLDSLQIADWQWRVYAPNVGEIETIQPEEIQQMLAGGWKGLPLTDVGYEVDRQNPREHNVAILD